MSGYDERNIPWPEWKIVRRLGHGGFGSVYEIERDVLGVKEKSAMKIVSVPPDQSQVEVFHSAGYDDESIRRELESLTKKMAAEYQLMISMKGHPNIVNCDDFSIIPFTDGIGWNLYIRMELLKPMVKNWNFERFSEEEVIRLGRDICQALALCERKHIIHRDIKPDNILISPYGDFKLGDFGVARTMNFMTTATRGQGTGGYMAPEVAKGEKYGKEADIYSLGMVLYWVLNRGKLPFWPIGVVPTMNQIQMAEQRRLSGEPLPPPVNGSDGLKRIVMKACSYRPGERYASAADMLRDLNMAAQYLKSNFQSGKKEALDDDYANTPPPKADTSQAASWQKVGDFSEKARSFEKKADAPDKTVRVRPAPGKNAGNQKAGTKKQANTKAKPAPKQGMSAKTPFRKNFAIRYGILFLFGLYGVYAEIDARKHLIMPRSEYKLMSDNFGFCWVIAIALGLFLSVLYGYAVAKKLTGPLLMVVSVLVILWPLVSEFIAAPFHEDPNYSVNIALYGIGTALLGLLYLPVIKQIYDDLHETKNTHGKGEYYGDI